MEGVAHDSLHAYPYLAGARRQPWTLVVVDPRRNRSLPARAVVVVMVRVELVEGLLQHRVVQVIAEARPDLVTADEVTMRRNIVEADVGHSDANDHESQRCGECDNQLPHFFLSLSLVGPRLGGLHPLPSSTGSQLRDTPCRPIVVVAGEFVHISRGGADPVIRASPRLD
jgi:hypothetical protein